MRVLQVTPEFPPPLIGGGGYHVYHLTRELARVGVEVKVVTLKNGSTSLAKRAMVETHFGRVKVLRLPAFYINAFSPIAYPLVPDLLPSLLREDPDIIHAHGFPFVTSDAALVATKIKRIPMILTLHGFPSGFKRLVQRTYFSLVGKQTLKKAQRIISVSRAVADHFRNVGALNERITVIPNGVDLEEYSHLPRRDVFRKRLQIEEDRKILLAIGRLEKIKGFQYLIEALPNILEKVPVDLIVGGPEFNYGAQLRKLAKERKVEDHVVFYGPMDQNEKLEAMAAADAIVIPSVYEGFGIVLLEAMAAGKAVVATTTGVAGEIIRDGKNGLLTPPADARALAEKLCSLLTDSRLSSLISRESRKAVEAFGWKRIAAETIEVYEKCLSR